jgi:hypothetical protein
MIASEWRKLDDDEIASVVTEQQSDDMVQSEVSEMEATCNSDGLSGG